MTIPNNTVKLSSKSKSFITDSYKELLEYFSELSDSSMVWVHVLSKKLMTNFSTLNNFHHQTLKIITEFEQFIDSWTTHGKPTPGKFCIYKNQIMIVANSFQVSGCSIDSSFKKIADINLQLGQSSEYAAYLTSEKEGLIGIKRQNIKESIANSTITENTRIINLSLNTMKQLRNNELEQPAATSWLSRYFK